MLRCCSAVLALLSSLIGSAFAQEAQRSECLAMANAPPRATPVSLRRLAAKTDEVTITYAGHSTYYIDTPGEVRIATDFSGAYTMGRLPDVVTMNRAHSTHYTLFPDLRFHMCCMAGATMEHRRKSNNASETCSSAM
jgi:Beta-lactamase superfamily domain